MTTPSRAIRKPFVNLAADRIFPTNRRLPDVWLPALPWCLTALRLGMAVVYVWFGALKLAETSPVASLVLAAYPFGQAPSWIVPVLGAVEVFIGLWFAGNRRLDLLFPLFLAHIASTFVVLVSAPSLAFQNSDPLALTTTGEFVIKNLVLVPAGTLVILLSTRPHERTTADGPAPQTPPPPQPAATPT